jgi:hypothetical protein
MRRLCLGLAVGLIAAPVEAQESPIAGTEPSQRPQGAPVLTEVIRAPDWYSKALTGVEEPYPGSLRFVEDQGAWFTPFSHPGMTGPYDIRHWHGGH